MFSKIVKALSLRVVSSGCEAISGLPGSMSSLRKAKGFGEERQLKILQETLALPRTESSLQMCAICSTGDLKNTKTSSRYPCARLHLMAEIIMFTVRKKTQSR